MTNAAETTHCLVFDLGAGSGRAMRVALSGENLRLEELHRFSGYETRLEDGPAWDVEAIRAGLREGLRRAADGPAIRSVAVDSWGVDFALIDGEGRLVDQPRTYRHPRGAQGMAALSAHRDLIAERSGVQVLPIITLFHLYEWARQNPERLQKADRLLMTADFYAHDLSGVAVCERTLACTSGLLSVATGSWDDAMLALTGLPRSLFSPVVSAGTQLGPLKPELAAGPALVGSQVIAAAHHDTACAAFALAPGEGEAFAVCGSWSLIGIDVAEGHIPAQAREVGLGLEGGIGGRALLTRSLPGLFLMRRLRESWARLTGEDIDFATLGRLARDADAAVPAIDVTDPLFFDPHDMVSAMRAFTPDLGDAGIGSLARALYTGLAKAVAHGLAQLSQFSVRPITGIRLGGGGGQDPVWRSFLAEASGCRVQAGIVEASVVGNALIQFVTLGALPSFSDAQALARQAADSGAWNA